MNSNFPTVLALTISALFVAGPSTSAAEAQPSVFYPWVQVGSNQTASVRVVTDQKCSTIPTSLAPKTLTERVPVSVPNQGPKEALTHFPPLHVCEAEIKLSPTATSVTVGGVTMDLPTQSPTRIAVIGDTGCRVEYEQQEATCKFPTWVFDQVAVAVADADPELIIHVGDYVYQYNCSHGDQGCNPQNDQLLEWKYWEGDFFSKAAPLLPKAPWIFARGNHEDCEKRNRGWLGWSLFFAPQNAENQRTECISEPKSHMVEFPKGATEPLSVFVYDTANEPKLHSATFNGVAAQTTETWIATHVPLWYGYSNYWMPLPTVDLVLGGHAHLFRLAQKDQRFPVQIVEGASGTKLDRPQGFSAAGFKTNYTEHRQFTYVILERIGGRTTNITLCGVAPNTPVAGQPLAPTVTAMKRWQLTQSGLGKNSVRKVVDQTNLVPTAQQQASCVPV